MTHQNPSPNRLSLPSAFAAAQWQRQAIFDEAAAYRLASQAAGPRKRRSLAPLLTAVGTALVNAGEWLHSSAARSTREPVTP